MSSLRQHFERVRAEKAARQKNADPRLSAQGRQLNRPLGNTMTRQTAPVQDAEYTDDDENPDAGSPIELKFFNDWESLAGIQSHAKKNELKAEFLPYYLPWIDGTVAAGVSGQNDMLVKLMVWALDTHDFDTATRIAEFALLNNMAMPEPFTRDVATVYAEQFASEVIKNIDNPSEYADILAKAIDITNDNDMPDQVRAKLYRAYGNALKAAKPTDAINAYEKAIKLDEAVGAKSDLSKLKAAQG